MQKDDVIYRQAAIDAIDEIESEVEDGDGFQYDKWRQYFCELSSAESRWIPVTKQLPKPNEREENGVERYYLIQNEFKDMMVAAYRGNNSGYTWWEQMYAYKPIEDKVIAWMPLPKPYKESK